MTSAIQLPIPRALPKAKPMMRPVACKHCPSTHHPADPECIDIRKASKEERLATAFPCAWDRNYYCRGYCLYMDISNADLAASGGDYDHD